MRLRWENLQRVKYSRILPLGNKLETTASTGKIGGCINVSDVPIVFLELGHQLLGKIV